MNKKYELLFTLLRNRGYIFNLDKYYLGIKFIYIDFFKYLIILYKLIKYLKIIYTRFIFDL